MRINKTKDLVKRKILLRPDKITIKNYPLNALAFFNSSLVFNEKEEKIKVYSRIIVGYYKYVSAITEMEIELNDSISTNYTASIILTPSDKYDFWGCEDPRAYKLNGKEVITYTGRTENYFSREVEKTIPITAIKYKNWKKRFLINYSSYEFGENLISDKNAFFFHNNSKLYFFHRVHIKDSGFKLIISEVENFLKNKAINRQHNLEKINVINYKEIEIKENFEKKVGWGTPPVKVEKNKYLLFLHGVGHDEVYRMFAVMMDNKTNIIGITKNYILEPKTVYEKYGDRPFTVFPCGAFKLDDSIYISYGAADMFTVIGEIKIDELLNEFLFFE